MSTFEDGPQNKLNKTWVKAGTFNAGNRKEDTTDKGMLYKPQAKLDMMSKEAIAKSADKVMSDIWHLVHFFWPILELIVLDIIQTTKISLTQGLLYQFFDSSNQFRYTLGSQVEFHVHHTYYDPLSHFHVHSHINMHYCHNIIVPSLLGLNVINGGPLAVSNSALVYIHCQSLIHIFNFS